MTGMPARSSIVSGVIWIYVVVPFTASLDFALIAFKSVASSWTVIRYIAWTLYWMVGKGEVFHHGIVTLYTALHISIRISFSSGIKGCPQASKLLKRAMEEE